MNKCFCVIFFLFSFLLMESQNWDSIRGGVFKYQLSRILTDSVHNKLLVSGRFNAKVGSLDARGICSWDGTKWDSLAGGINTHDKTLNPQNPDGMVLSCIPMNGKLLVGGYFSSIGGVNTTGIALWDGVKWDSLPKRAFRYDKSLVISDFLKKGSLLYIAGSFDTIAGQSTKGLGTWDGINFSSVPLPIGSGFQNISSIIEYQNEIYIAGDGFLVGPNNNARDVFKFNGTSWVSTTGNGILGGASGVADLEIYNNELYASGHFTKTDGNAGDHIMKWNGSQWQDVGFGDQPYFITIRKMLVHHNKLWVFGGFYDAANAFASMAAVYDGTNWCGLKDTLDNVIGTAAVYNDTIYIGGGFWTANSDSLHFIAKLKDPNLFNQCVNVVGVDELLNDAQVAIFPNPANNKIVLEWSGESIKKGEIIIYDAVGQSLATIPVNIDSGLNKQEVNVSDLKCGLYFVILKTSTRILNSKFVKE